MNGECGVRSAECGENPALARPLVNAGHGRSDRRGLGERGVALLIVLLVTALLIALIFEFAYGTRVSLRSAVNYRDSQRAYYLARSGVNFVGALLSANLKNSLPQNNLEQREWQTAPLTGDGDMELRVRWEDEAGKINIGVVLKDNESYRRLGKLFEIRSVSQEALERMCPSPTDRVNFTLLTDLHKYLSDEEFRKVKDFVTVSPVSRIDINTAPAEVLQSIGLTAGMAGMIVERRRQEPFKQQTEVNDFLGRENTTQSGQLDVTSSVFKVQSFATVGGYTKQIEAVIQRTTAGFTIQYWRSL